jgi:hypothetical protein
MPEMLSFLVSPRMWATMAQLRVCLPAPCQVLGPVPTAVDDGWSAFILVDGSIRGVTLVSESEPDRRRIDLRREACGSAADYGLMRHLSGLLASDPDVLLEIDGSPEELPGLDRFFDAGRTRAVRVSDWKMVHDRYFRMGRGRAVLTSPLIDLTVNLEDMTFAGELAGHLEELEARMANRIHPILNAAMGEVEEVTTRKGTLRYTRWSMRAPTLVTDVEFMLIEKAGAAVGLVAQDDLLGMLGTRAVVTRSRPPRRTLLPPLDSKADSGLLSLIERSARSRPPPA